MATSTTIVNACGVQISLDNDLGVLTEITGEMTSANIELTVGIADYVVFADDNHYRTACRKDAKISLGIFYSTDDLEGMGIIKQWWDEVPFENRSVQIDVPTSGGGNDRYSAEVLLESATFPMSADDASPILVSVELVPNGQLDISQIAS